MKFQSKNQSKKDKLKYFFDIHPQIRMKYFSGQTAIICTIKTHYVPAPPITFFTINHPAPTLS